MSEESPAQTSTEPYPIVYVLETKYSFRANSIGLVLLSLVRDTFYTDVVDASVYCFSTSYKGKVQLVNGHLPDNKHNRFISNYDTSYTCIVYFRRHIRSTDFFSGRELPFSFEYPRRVRLYIFVKYIPLMFPFSRFTRTHIRTGKGIAC